MELPMIHLTQKGQAYVWNIQREESFQELKKRRMLALDLILPDTKESFVLYYDALKMGLSGVLMYNG